MTEDEIMHKHELRRAIRALAMVVEFAKRGYDFSTEAGKEMLADAEREKKWLEKQLGIAD